eukprot:2332-Pyramimonas_sp.AAC.1
MRRLRAGVGHARAAWSGRRSMQGAAVRPRCLCRLIAPPTVLTAWPCGHFQVLIRAPVASEVQLYDLPGSRSACLIGAPLS